VPVLTLIGGPNGSGKSTLSEWVELAGQGLLVDPDAVARQINPANPRGAALEAGRKVLEIIDGYFERRESFAVETTLSSHASLRLIDEGRARNYEVHLIFVALNSPERNIARIRNRVALGGHFIPDEDVRRRYYRSISNLHKAMQLVDMAKVYDNSGDEQQLLMSALGGVVTQHQVELPDWVYTRRP
jgi:predicted ABC-type ATPase